MEQYYVWQATTFRDSNHRLFWLASITCDSMVEIRAEKFADEQSAWHWIADMTVE